MTISTRLLNLTSGALIAALLFGCGRKEEAPTVSSIAEAVCTYAPSQSKLALAASTAAGGAGGTASAVASAAGLTAVTHSSGAYIFTGASGYVAGTLGAATIVPVAVTVGALAGGAAVTVELVCAPKNHPDLVGKVKTMAKDFAATQN
jgi:hypothetical protein